MVVVVVVVVVVSASQLFFRLRVGRPVLALRGYIAPEWTMIIWTLRGRMCYKYSLSAKEIIFLSERNSFLKIMYVRTRPWKVPFKEKKISETLLLTIGKKTKNIICSPVHLSSPLTI